MAKKKNKKTKKTEQKRHISKLSSTLYTMAHELPVYGEWLDDVEIEKIENDPVVLSSISKRKAATLKKELIIHTDSDHIAKELEKIMDYTFRAQVLDTVLQGMSVFELNWYNAGGYWYPRPLERDYRAFSLLDGKLIYEFVEVDERKVIHLTHRAKFNAQMGRPLYATLFWLRRFKAASMEFWMEFMERFGKPWVIGKTDADKNAMAQELYAMLAGDVAVIEPEDQIDLKSPADKGSFKEILDYIDDQIREAITGGNLTGNVRGGSYAAAKTHKEIGEEIALADAHLLTEAISEVIAKFRDLNAYMPAITFDLVDKDNPNIDLATRDKVLADLMKGRFVFSEAYLKQTYNIDFEAQPQPVIQGSALPFSATPKMPHDPIDQFLSDTDTQPEEDALFETLERVFADADNYEEAYEKLLDLYSDLDEVKLLEAFEKYLQTSMLYGNAEAESEDDQA